MALRVLGPRGEALAGAGDHVDLRSQLLREASRELRALDDADPVHDRPQARIQIPLRLEAGGSDAAVPQSDGEHVREAVVGRLSSPGVPLGWFAPDLALGPRIDLHLDGFDLFRSHLAPQGQRHRQRRLRVILGREELEVRALDGEGPPTAAEGADLEGPRHLLAETMTPLEGGRGSG